MKQREIKFRALNKETKKWKQADMSNLDYVIRWAREKGWENIVWLEFTDLLDKNGKEIYEGDIILRSGFAINEFDGLEVIEFDNRIDTDGIYDKCSGWAFDNGEVIGNIYENKELLK